LAIALSPTSGLGFIRSFQIFALASFLLLGLALTYLMRAVPNLAGVHLGSSTVLALTLGYLPIAATMFGGQNTGLTLALLCATFAAVRLEHSVMAGLFLGLLTYKPQFALILGVALLLQRRFKVVGLSMVVGLAHYGVGALVCGWGWPLDYLSMLGEHMPLEMAQNGLWHISLPPMAKRLLPAPASTVLTAVGTVTVLYMLIRTILRGSPGRWRSPAWFALAVASSMLLSPHLQYYDVGIIALPVILCVEAHMDRFGAIPLGMKAVLAIGFLSYPAWQLSETLGVQPLFFLVLAVLLWSRRLAVDSPAR
jgi:hypothetical protein